MSYRYKGYIIYTDQNGSHVFTQPHGRGGRYFDTEDDAEEFVDELVDKNNSKLNTYIVRYILNTSDSEAEEKIEAHNEKEALYKVEKALGKNFYKPIRVELVDDTLSEYWKY